MRDFTGRSGDREPCEPRILGFETQTVAGDVDASAKREPRGVQPTLEGQITILDRGEAQERLGEAERSGALAAFLVETDAGRAMHGTEENKNKNLSAVR